MRRILLTASRTWNDPASIHRRLDREAAICRTNREPLVLVHGDAEGGDTIGRDWAENRAALGWPVSHEAHPADWLRCADTCKATHRKIRRNGVTSYCPTAGHRRNAVMVGSGADQCLAAIRDESSGASGCAKAANKAGIPTEVLRWEDRDEDLWTRHEAAR